MVPHKIPLGHVQCPSCPSLMDTISVLCDDPTAVADPYADLKNILLQSCSLSIAQKTTCLLDHFRPAVQ
jgi:hypothetical protein